MSYFCKKWHVFFEKMAFFYRKPTGIAPAIPPRGGYFPFFFKKGCPKGGVVVKNQKSLRKIPSAHRQSLI